MVLPIVVLLVLTGQGFAPLACFHLSGGLVARQKKRRMRHLTGANRLTVRTPESRECAQCRT